MQSKTPMLLPDHLEWLERDLEDDYAVAWATVPGTPQERPQLRVYFPGREVWLELTAEPGERWVNKFKRRYAVQQRSLLWKKAREEDWEWFRALREEMQKRGRMDQLPPVVAPVTEGFWDNPYHVLDFVKYVLQYY